MFTKINFFFLVNFFFLSHIIGQEDIDCFDFTYSNLEIDFLIDDNFINAHNEMHFKNVCYSDTINIKLFTNLIVDSVLLFGYKVDFKRINDNISIPNIYRDSLILDIFYHGHPKISENPPWDGGFVYDEDIYGRHWVGLACQLSGASLWWPNEEQLFDEPDSMRLKFNVPDPYMAIANGQLVAELSNSFINDTIHSNVFEWFISFPVNNYNVTVNIGVYDYFSDQLDGLMGPLSLNYYVLPYNKNIAQYHFKQSKQVLSVFETLFGPYPFYRDGYKLVETPYLGMEHQSCISYGNKFNKGYLGKYPSNMDFDFIILHESGHEWWGNNISMKTFRDMWIHESFCTYAEALYVEEVYGYEKMIDYLNYQKKNISFDSSIIQLHDNVNSHYNLNMYYKGSWMLHTLRSCINNDDLWFGLFKDIQNEFSHKNVGTHEMIQFINLYTSLDLSSFFDVYLYNSKIPILEYRLNYRNNICDLEYRWNEGFSNLPVPLSIKQLSNDVLNDTIYWILPSNNWQTLTLNLNESQIGSIYVDNILIDIDKID